MPASHPVHVPAPAYELRTRNVAVVAAATVLLTGFLEFSTGSMLLGAAHLTVAFVGFLLARTFRGARFFLVCGSVVYLALHALGPMPSPI